MTTYYTIAAGFRTGSSTFCDQLRELSVGYPIEGAGRSAKEVNGYVGAKIMPRAIKRADKHIKNTTKWIYLYRENTVDQAVSLLAAAQTGHFSHHRNADNRDLLVFDFHRLNKLLKKISKEQETWETFFKENNITPYRISYEEFFADRDKEMNKVLAYLGSDMVSEGHVPSRKKQHYEETKDWAKWYQECLDGTREIVKLKREKNRRNRAYHEQVPGSKNKRNQPQQRRGRSRRRRKPDSEQTD